MRLRAVPTSLFQELLKIQLQLNKHSNKLSYTVSVPANSAVTISAWYERVEGLTLNYTAEAEVTGLGKRISKYNDIVENIPVDSAIIREYLKNSKFESQIVRITNNSIVYRVEGTVEATFGTKGQLAVNGKAVVN